jgi:hypothetical protein
MSNFNDVKDPILRAYNRYVVANNLKEDAGRAYAEEYLNQFSTVDQTNIFLIGSLLRKQGYKATIEFIRQNVIFEEDEEAA